MNFAGDHCEFDVSDLSFFISLLLWQNLFQLLSYLILRMDDEPAVEWAWTLRIAQPVNLFTQREWHIVRAWIDLHADSKQLINRNLYQPWEYTDTQNM